MQRGTRPILNLLVAAATLGIVTGARAADPAPAAAAPAKTNYWETSAGLGFALATGNSESVLFTANFVTQHKDAQNEIRFGADGGYGEATTGSGTNAVTAKNTAFVRGAAQYNRLFSEKLYGYGRVEGLYDEIAEIDYRVPLSVGVGYYFIKDERTLLSAEIGPGYIFEKVAGDASDYATLRIAQRWEYKLSKTARLIEGVEFLPEVTDWNNYIINGMVGLEADITKKMAVRLVLQDTFDNVPAPGKEKNDLKLTAGLQYKF
jgi:putative salt-induced outer membrane protein YdiY